MKGHNINKRDFRKVKAIQVIKSGTCESEGCT